jgi:hypothetical protein
VGAGAEPVIGQLTMRAALVAVSLLAAMPAAASPLDELVSPGGDSACFARNYDNAHLRKNPRQQTAAMAVWLTTTKDEPGVSLGIAVTRRGDALPFFAQGGCEWVDGANRDIRGQPVVKTFKKTVGADCMMSARPDVFATLSAKEGGALVIDRGKDRDTLMVYLDDVLTMVKRANRGKQISLQFGADDRVFMLGGPI